MKNQKLLFALTITGCLWAGVNSQAQVIYSEDFQGGMPGSITLINNDGLTPATNVAYVDDAWVVRDNFDETGDSVAASTSWYTPAGTADDWLITPAINLGTNSILTWDIKAQDPSYPDGYEVRISTSTPTIANFNANAALFSTAGEVTTWTTRSVDLAVAGYASQTVYIAFRNNSTDQFLLLLDDIEVRNAFAFDAEVLGFAAPRDGCDLTANEDVTIGITNVGLNALTGFNVGYILNGGQPVVENVGALSIAPGDTADYTFTQQADLTGQASNTIFAYSAHASDPNQDNDTAGITIDEYKHSFPPDYVTSFENGDPDFVGWLLDDVNADDNEWFFAVNVANTGNNMMACEVNPDNATVADDWLFSKCFDMQSGVNYEVSYWFRSFNQNPVGSENSQTMDIWFGTDQDPANMTTFITSHTFDDSTNYSFSSSNFGVPSNGTYYIGFHVNTPATDDTSFVLLDDFAVRPVQTFDADLTGVFFPDEYRFIPINHVQQLTLGGIITNDGSGTITGAKINFDIDRSGSSVFSSSSNDTTLTAGNSAVRMSQTNYTPNDTGLHEIGYATQIDQTDGDPSNDSISYQIRVTENIYCRTNTVPTSGVWAGAGTAYITGTKYDLLIQDTVDLISGWVRSNTPVGATIYASIYGWDGVNDQPTTRIARSNEYTIQAGDPGSFVSLPVDSGSPILAAGIYVFCVGYDTGLDLLIGTDSTNYIASANSDWFLQAGGTWAPTGLDNNAMVHFTTGGCPDSLGLNAVGIADTCTNSIGAASVSPSLGESPYTYSWSTGATSASITGLAAGSYSVDVTDAAGCMDDADFTIADIISSFTLNASGKDDTCSSMVGSVSVSASGGIAPYTYSWTGGQTNATATGLASGTYKVIVSDQYNCMDSTTVAIGDIINTLNLTTSSTDATCGNPDGSASVDNVTGGIPPYTYSWSTGATTTSISNVLAGTYKVVVDDAYGCSDSSNVSVSDQGAPSLSTSHTDPTCYGGGDGTATVNVTGGTPPYNYSWTGGQTTATATGFTAGTYDIVVTDDVGCSVSSVETLDDPDSIMITPTISDVSCNGGSDGTASVTAANGTAPYDYSWSTSATDQSIFGLTAGNYTVTVTDDNSCTNDLTVSISEADPLTLSMGSNDATCNGAADGSATVTPGGGTPPYDYFWETGETGATATGLSADTYTVTVTDDNGCSEMDSVAVGEPPAINLSVNTTDATCGAADGMASVTPSNGIPPYSYIWSTGSTNSSISGLTAGSYGVTVTDNNNCSAATSVAVSDAGSPTLTTDSTGVSCNGGSDGSAMVTATGGTPPYDYSWDGGATTQSITGLTAGTYGVTVTDDNSCASSASVIVPEPGTLTLVGSTNAPTCAGGNDADASVSPSGGTAPYNYSWDNGQTTQTAINLTAGNYDVTVTDDNGCVETELITVTDPAAITLNGSSTDASCGGSDGTATITATNGLPPYTYSWVNSQTSQTATGLSAGAYAVEVTDDNGCMVSTSVGVSNANGPSLTTGFSDVDCFGGNNGTATVNATGGTMPYSYSWSNGETTQSIANLTADVYSIAVEDDNNCTANAVVTVSEPDELITVMNSNDVSCNGNSDGDASVLVFGGTTPYNYNWNTGSTASSISNLTSGTYTVTIMDDNGCSTIDSAVIDEPDAISLSTSSVDANCGNSDGSATVTASNGVPPYAYSWTGGQTGQTATGLSAGAYVVEVTDDNGCSALTAVAVNDAGSPSVTTSSTDVSCNGGNDGSGTVNVTGGTPPYNYSWTNSATTQTTTGLTAGIYSITVTDDNNCSASGNVTISEPDALFLSLSGSDPVCNGGADGMITVAVTGGTSPFNYSWSNGSTTATNSNLTAGTYGLNVTDDNGCSASSFFSITDPDPISLTTGSSNSTCGNNDGTATVSPSDGTPPYSFSWDNGQTTQTATNLLAGTYTVLVTDDNGCDAQTSVAVSDIGAPSTATNSTDVTCPGGADGTADVTASAGTPPYTYSWSNANTNNSITGLTADTYGVTVTDDNGCKASATVVVDEPDPFSIPISITDASCNGSADGMLSASITGGTSPYGYSWSNGQTTSTATGLTAGTYSLTVTDDNACTEVVNETVGEPAAMTMTFSTTDASCNGVADGMAIVTPNGGTAPYTYSWDNSQTNDTATGLTAVRHGVTVTDDIGCSVTDSVTINEPTAIALNAGSTDVSCAGGSDGEATVAPTGGTGPYSYDWSTGATTATASGLTAGNYNITVTDDNNCTESSTVSVAEPDEIQLTTTTTDAACGNADGSATVNVTNGVPPLSYSWSNGFTTQTALGLSAGTYTVTVTDDNNCTATATAGVNNAGAPSLSTTTVDVTCAGGNDGSATVTATGGTTPYAYDWSDGQTTATATNLLAKTYTIEVTDNEGCISTDVVTITEPAPITITANTTDASCGGDDGSALGIVSGGVPPFSYSWSTGATSTLINGLTAGTYNLEVTDDNGCVETTIVGISNIGAPTITVDQVMDVTCNGAGDGSVDVTISPAGPHNILWSNGATTDDISGLDGDLYSITVTDTANCSASEVANVHEPAKLVVNITPDNDAGTAMAGVSGGTPPYTYLWNNGQSEATATGLTTGNYTVTVTDDNGCSSNESVAIVTGIKVASIEPRFELYPNPTLGSITLDIALATSNDIRIELYNVLGEMVEHENVSQVSTLTLHMDLSSFENGIYFVKLVNDDQVITKRITLTH